MRVSIVGSGYVGTTIAACFADLDHEVVNIDVDENVVETINSGNPRSTKTACRTSSPNTLMTSPRRLQATTDYDAVLDTDVTFLCLPTPQSGDGSIDLSIMETGAEQPGETLGEKDD